MQKKEKGIKTKLIALKVYLRALPDKEDTEYQKFKDKINKQIEMFDNNENTSFETSFLELVTLLIEFLKYSKEKHNTNLEEYLSTYVQSFVDSGGGTTSIGPQNYN